MTIKRIQSIAVTLCGLFTSVIMILAVTHFKDFVEHQKVWETKKKELADLKEEIINIKKSLDLYEREKLDFQRYLFREQDVPAFIDGISKFAQKSMVNIKDMKTGRFEEVVIAEKEPTAHPKADSGKNQKDEATQKKERLKRALTLAAMPIRVQMDGPYPSIVEFLGHLEGFDQLVTITDVGIVAGLEYPILKCEFTLKIYSLKTLEELQTR